MSLRSHNLAAVSASGASGASRRRSSAPPPSGAGASPEAAVLGKALLRASERLNVSQKDLALVVGLSSATISRLASGSFALEPSSKSGELALLFLRVYRGLDALVGGEDEKARAWFHAENDHVGGVPAERVRTVEGLTDVARYLDAMRGRL
jgi:transcriptional regulator with XRE-family HTH domain